MSKQPNYDWDESQIIDDIEFQKEEAEELFRGVVS